MSEQSGKRNNIAAVQNPLARKGVTVSVNTGGFHAAPFIIFIKHMIARALHKLLTEDVAKQKVLFCFVFAIFQELG